MLDDVVDEAVLFVVDAQCPVAEGCRKAIVPLIADAGEDIPGHIGSSAADHSPSVQIPFRVEVNPGLGAHDRVDPGVTIVAAESRYGRPARREFGRYVVI